MPAVLNYFGIPARGEATRVALAVAGVDYEDKRMSFEEFGASEFKTVPVYQMDGTDYTQSTALLRYAGKLGGQYPECPLASLKVDEIVMIAEDVFINLFSTMGEKDDAKKMNKGANRHKVEANTASPFCVGGSLTIADIQIHAVIATVQAGFLTGIPTTMVEDMCPSLKDLDNAVMEHPKVKAYYASKA
ncbi:unnamed protein product [Laminaria digitata]